jgi:hypothetical protein
MRIGGEHGFPFWQLYGSMIDAAACIASGDAGAGARLREGSEHWRGAGAALGRCWQLTFMAEALRMEEQHEAAERLLREALAFCEEHDSRYFEPEVRRQLAVVLFDSSNPGRDVDAALEECAKALMAAKSHGADWWALATLMTQIRAQEAAPRGDFLELRDTVGRFTPSSNEPPLLCEARALVAETQAAER